MSELVPISSQEVRTIYCHHCQMREVRQYVMAVGIPSMRIVAVYDEHQLQGIEGGLFVEIRPGPQFLDGREAAAIRMMSQMRGMVIVTINEHYERTRFEHGR